MKLYFQAMMLGLACIGLALMAQESNVVLPQDKGPGQDRCLRLSRAEMQKDYKLFSTKCSKCHTIARPINTMMTRDEWERYVKRMMHKPNSGISDKPGKGDLRVPGLRPDQPEGQEPEGLLPRP